MEQKNVITSYTFFKKLCQLSFVNTIYLFGSRARGDHDERSDIDLAIDCSEASRQDWSKVTKIIDNADTLLKIDCIRLDTLKDQELRDEIEKQHIVLYERKNNG